MTLASIRSKHTGHEGSSRKAGVGGGTGRVGSDEEGEMGGRNGSSIKGKTVSTCVVDEGWKVTLWMKTT